MSFTFEDFKMQVGTMLKDPDKAVSTADDFIEQAKVLFDTYDAQQNRITELEAKNNDLRDANIKLLLRESFQAPSTEEKPEKTNDEILKELSNKLLQKGE